MTVQTSHLEAYTCHGPVEETGGLPASLRASWERCRRLGLTPGGRPRSVVLSPSELARRQRSHQVMLEAARSPLNDFLSALSNYRLRVCLTDEEGYLLEVHCTGSEREPGSEEERLGESWAEAVRGTNAIGLVVEEMQPAIVRTTDHFLEALRATNAVAAPIRDKHGDLAGVICLRGPSQEVTRHTLGMVVAAAHQAEREMQMKAVTERVQEQNRRLSLLYALESVLAGSCPAGALADRCVELLRDFAPRRAACLYHQTQSPDELVAVASHLAKEPLLPTRLLLDDPGPVAECLRSGQMVHHRDEEEALDRPDGRPRALLALPVAWDGRPAAVLAVGDYESDFSDSERQLYEAVAVRLNSLARSLALQRALDAEANMRRAILDQMDVGVVMLDLSTHRISWNRVLAQYLVGTEQEMQTSEALDPCPWELGRFPFRCAGPDCREAVRKVAETGVMVGSELTVFCDPPHTFKVMTGPVRSSSGQVEGVIQTFTDVTSYRQLERRKAELIAMISHELRTPLTSIQGYRTLLEQYSGGDTGHERLLQGLRRETEALAELIERVVVVSRLEAERKFALQPVPLRKTVMVALRGLEALAASLGVEVEVTGCDVTVEGDPDSLQQAFANLLHNAIKFSPRGGRVTVRLSQAGSEARVQVMDDGPGIAPEHHSAIFERFYRVPAPEAVSLPGTGMGLYIVRRLIRRHGGEVLVESRPGSGATFTVSLPEGVTDCGESEDPGCR